MNDVAKGSIDGYILSTAIDAISEAGKKKICTFRIRLKLKTFLNDKSYPAFEDIVLFNSLANYIRKNLLETIVATFEIENLKKRSAAEKAVIDLAISYYKDNSSSLKKGFEKDIERFVNDCIIFAHSCMEDSLSTDQKRLLAANQRATFDNLREYEKEKDACKADALHQQMAGKIKFAWNTEYGRSPSLKSISFCEDIVPKGFSEIIRLSVIDNECWDRKEQSLQEVVDMARNNKSYSSIFLYGNGGIGKTVALLKLKSNAYMIYIPLRFVHKGIKDYIYMTTFGADKELYDEFLRFCRSNDNPPIIMLDGLNEMDQKERKALKDEINNEFLGFHIQFIISARYDAAEDFELGNMLRLSCLELSEELISNYLNMLEIKIPNKGSRLFKIINTPFMLMLYASVERQGKEFGDATVENINPGSIIWNYLQCEQRRMKDDDNNPGLATVVLFYVAPYIAFSMISRKPMTFSIPNDEYYKLIDVACSEYESDRENHCLRGNLASTLPNCSINYDKDLIFDFLFNKLCLCVNSDSDIQFVHQHFRDSLAALYIYQKSICDFNVAVGFLSDSIDQYIFDFLVDYFQLFDENKDFSNWFNLWETCRLNNSKNNIFVSNMLEIYRRIEGNDISSIDFSNMDLSGVSLRGYKLTGSRNHFKGTSFNREVFIGKGHNMAVSSLSWCSDSSGFFSASYDMSIRYWNLSTGENTMIGELKDIGHYIRSAKICPVDKNIIVYGGDDGKLIRATLKNNVWSHDIIIKDKHWISTIAWDISGNYVVYGDSEGNIKQIYFNNSNRYLYHFHGKSVRCIDCSPKNRIVSGGDDGLVCVWNQGQNAPRTCWRFSDSIKSVKWLDDGDHIAVVIKNKMFFIDCNTANPYIEIDSNQILDGMQMYEIDGNIFNASFQHKDDSVYCALFTSDKIYIKRIFLTNNSIQVIDVASRMIDTNETGVVYCSEWDPKCEKLVFGSRNGSVWMGNLSLQEEVLDRFEIEKVSSGSLTTARCSLWSKSGNYFASGYDDGTVRVRKTDNYRCFKVLEGHIDNVKCIAWPPITEDKIVSGSGDGTVKLWSIKTGDCKSFEIDSPVNCLLWINENLIIGGTDKGEVIFIDVNNETILRDCKAHKNKVYSLTPSIYNDDFISAGDDMLLCLWKKTPSGKYVCCQRILSSHDYSIRSIATCNTEYRHGIYSAGNDCEVFFHEIDETTGELTYNPECLQHYHDDFIYSIAISSLGDYVLSGCTDASLSFWNTRTNNWAYAICGHEGFVWHVSVSPLIAGKYFLSSSSSDGTVRIWDFPDEDDIDFIGQQGPKIGSVRNLGDSVLPAYFINVLPEVNVVGCDFSGAIISDDGLKLMLEQEGAEF